MDQVLNSEHSGNDRYLPLLVMLFIGSGFAALIYEVVWLQMLQLVIGLSSLSLGVLLGTFMGGMCLGSLLLPRLVSVRHHPLRVYAFLELGIGITGLILLLVLPRIENLYTGIAGYGLFRSVLFRSLIASVCLLPPTILMGATLPAISRWVKTTPKGISWMGFFYGGNIFGAVAGCLIAGFYLLRVFDIAVATYVALAMNIAVALFAILISGVRKYKSVLPETERREPSNLRLKIIYITIALSGMAALGSEVVWTRLLSIMLGSTVYTFSIILASFLVGLGIGSGTGAYLGKKLRSPGFALGICQLLLILAIAWTSYMITRAIPYKPVDYTAITSSWYLFQLDLARSALAVLPPAILWGASFPLALAAAAIKDQDPGRLVGGIYAANTIGAITGSLAFSMIGIPVLGTAFSQKLLVVISATAAIMMLISVQYSAGPSGLPLSGRKKTFLKFRPLGIAAGIITLVVLITGFITSVPWHAIAFGRYMANYNNLRPLTETSGEITEINLSPIYVGEGLNGSVVVTQFDNGIRQFHSIGKVQASTDPRDMRLQRMLGHITGLLVEKPESVLVVGCGAGITAGTFIVQPDVTNITVCDIEALVPKVIAPMFSKENYGIADGIEKENPHSVNGKKVLFEFDDGRHYISTSDKKYDIISSDPIDPWGKGAAALYTAEYFKICKAHLNPGGAMSLWIPLYENSLESVKSMVSTFFSVFPNGIIWSNDVDGIGYDMVLFGQAEPTRIDIEKLEEKYGKDEYAQVRRSLADVGFLSVEELLGTYAGRAEDLDEWMTGAQINTDRNMRLSYLAGASVNDAFAAEIFTDICRYYKFPENLFTGPEQKLESLHFAIGYKMWY